MATHISSSHHEFQGIVLEFYLELSYSHAQMTLGRLTKNN